MSMVGSGKFVAVVLAAGTSSRMGDINKLLVEFDGEPMVRRVVETALAVVAGHVVVVTGFQAEKVHKALSNLEVTFVHNAAFDQGLSTSVRTGIEAVAKSACEGVVVFLGDMPLVTKTDAGALIVAFQESKNIIQPIFEGKRGNPILWGRDYFAEMAVLTGDKGARDVLKKHSDKVILVKTGPGVLKDFDTPQTLQQRSD